MEPGCRMPLKGISNNPILVKPAFVSGEKRWRSDGPSEHLHRYSIGYEVRTTKPSINRR
jgi:hypothetical protein